MTRPHLLLPLLCLAATAVVAAAQDAAPAPAPAVPEKAARYHEALLRRPHNAALFDRFFGAWLDERPVDALGGYLAAEAAGHGGAHWTVLAAYRLRRGEEDGALAALGQGIAALPDDPALALERGKLRLRRLEFGLAREDFARVAAGADEALAQEAAKLAGKAWLREGKTAEAVRAWDAVLAARPGDEDLLEDLVETAAAEGETAQALAYCDKLVAATRDPYRKTLRELRRGDLLVQAGRHDEAVAAYAATLGRTGAGSWLEREVLAQIDKAFRRQDRLGDLLAELEKLAAAYPQRLLVHRQLARLEAARGDTDAAIGRFREVLRRSPGEREPREEFVRLLTDTERYGDAAAELGKLAELSPADAGLQLQLAALRARQDQPAAVLEALEKARVLLGNDESAGLRVAGLMLQYNLAGQGDDLLRQLAAAPGASPAALEALAARHGAAGRKEEALALLKRAGAGDDPDILLRATGAISALGETAAAHDILAARAAQFSGEPRFLAALAQAALAAGRPAAAVPQALKLVRLARQPGELAEAVQLATRVLAGAGDAAAIRDTLAARTDRAPGETCLLAALAEDAGDFEAVAASLGAAPDPLLIRFHAALLDRRGDFPAAIAVLTRLGDTAEGKQAAYFKDLAELQQRAGQTAAALATVGRWKLAAPGDKAAWLAGSRLQRDSGKPDEAARTLRQAVGRFEGDADLAASLAALHDEAGQWAEAEAIYWKLYDDAPAPADQARWAAQLAQLALKTGRAGELEEQLRERARNNRQAIGPLLALAELARVTNSEDKRRDLLLDAVRLQPKDLDLRLQIANLEEQSGNPERVAAVLEEALPFDVNGRIRTALAQAYLRQGEALKGMRELRLLSGKSGFDPRSAEVAAAALADSKLHEEAINLLRAELPAGGDWRTRYLLATLLEEDGREKEALPIFLELLQAQGEIPSLAVKPLAPSVPRPVDQTPPEVQKVQRHMAASQMAYMHQQGNRGRGYGGYNNPGATLVGGFYLPDTAEDARQFALAHLSRLSKTKTGEPDEAVRAQIKAVGVANVDFLVDLAASAQPSETPKQMDLLEKYPGEPGLFEWLMYYGGGMYNSRKIDEKVTRHILENPGKISAVGRFSGWVSIAMNAPAEDPAWDGMLAAGKECVEGTSADAANTISYRMMYLLQGQYGTCPEARRPAAKRLMLDGWARNVKEHPEYAHGGYSLTMAALGGTPEEWLAEINATVTESRKPATRQPGNRYSRSRFGQILQYAVRSSRGSGYNPWSSMGEIFTVPTVEALVARSVPQEVFAQFGVPDGNGEETPPPVSVEALVKRSAEIESPFLRAWLAAKAGDEKALAEALAVEPPATEAGDFQILRAALAVRDKKPAEGFAALTKARESAGSDREYSGWINTALIAVAGEMSPDERAAKADELQTNFLQLRQIFGNQGGPLLAAQARQLGLEHLAKRIDTPGGAGARGPGTATGPAAMATAAASRGSSSSSGSGASVEKIRKFVGERKYEAAAREVLQGVRTQRQNNSAYYFRSQLPELIGLLGKDGVAELLKLVDPGESKSLVRRLEFVDICGAAGKPERALATLEALAKERTDDGGIAARLVFAIPPDQADRKIDLMNRACKSEEFVAQAAMTGQRLDDESDDQTAQAFFDTVARWLETADPEQTAGANLTWVSYFGKRFFEGALTSPGKSLFAAEKEAKEDDTQGKDAWERQKKTARRLATGMLRHASCAEEGFRLLAAAKTWKIEAPEMDANARTALLAVSRAVVDGDRRRISDRSFFSLVSGNGSSSSGSDLSESSSAAWLVGRMKNAGGTAEVFPPDFVAALKQANPAVGDLMTAMTRDLKTADLEEIWKSDVLKSDGGRLGQMLRPVVLKRVSMTPDSVKFFTGQIDALPPASVVNRNGSGDTQGMAVLFASAIANAATGKPEELDAVAKSISRAVFGENPDFTVPANQSVNYQRVNFMENLCSQMGGDPAVMVRFQEIFYRLGIPVDDDEYAATRPFQNKRFSKPEEAIAFLQSLGWLSEAGQWQPYACYIFRSRYSGNGQQAGVEPHLMLEHAVQYLGYGGMNTSDLVKQLKERKEGRFGSLMIAAALSRGNERSELAARAFAGSSAELAEVSPAQVESLALVLPWLDQDARAKLPETFRAKAAVAEKRLREEIVARADKFLSATWSGRGENALYETRELVPALLPYDLDKAVAVFVAADQTYTDALVRGGRYSNSSSGDWQYSQRDYAFGELCENAGNFSASPDLQLRFFAKILASPSGKRLVFNDTNYSDRSVFPQAAVPLIKDFAKEDDADFLVNVVAGFKSVAPELRSVALPCFLLAGSDRNAGDDGKKRAAMLPKLAKLTADDPQAAKLATARLALWSWKHCTPEEKAAARAVFADLAGDADLPDVARVVFAADLLGRLPKDELLRAPFPAALGKLYGDYCAGERTAVTLVSSWLLKTLVKAPFRDESVEPLYVALAGAFWDNTLASKSAGHPPIPADLARLAFSTALMGKDGASVARYLPRIKDSLAGKLSSVILLMQLGQPEMAKQLSPLPADAFDTGSGEEEFRYDRELEDAFAAYKQTKPDVVTLQKLELEMLRFPPGEDAAAPAEPVEARAARLIDSVVAATPAGNQLALALDRLLAISPGNPKLLPLLAAWAKAHPVEEFFLDNRGSGSEGAERIRAAAVSLHGLAAMHAFAAGDTAPLQRLGEAAEIPTGTRNNRGYYMSRDYALIVRQMAIAIRTDVAAGLADGFQDGLPAWNDFLVRYAELIAKRNSSEISGALVISRFLACWTGDGEKWKETLDRLPKQIRRDKDGEPGPVLVPFCQIASEDVTRTDESGRAFLAAVIVRPGFAPVYAREIGWVARVRESGYEKAIDALALDPPADTAREALVELREQAGELKREKDPDGAIAAYRQALESCPPGDEWKYSRGVMKWKMADVMLAANRKDQATETFLGIAPDEIADWLKDRYDELAKKLDVKKSK